MTPIGRLYTPAVTANKNLFVGFWAGLDAGAIAMLA
jgi:hypothetical protein